MRSDAAGSVRLRSLDALRALAVLLVIGRHTQAPWQSFWQRGGWAGVDLFFVLSGFLISGLLFAEHKARGAISFKRFFIRRGFKIYPAFYAFVFIILALGQRPGPLSFGQIFAELFFFQNYAIALFGHTWSLAVEEHFYVLLPLLLIFLSRGRREAPFARIPLIFLGVAAACLAMRVLTMRNVQPYSYYTHFFPTHLRIDALFFGVCISYFYNYQRGAYDLLKRKMKYVFPWLGPLLFVPAFFLQLETSFFLHTIGLTLIYAGSGMILVSFLDAEPRFGGWAGRSAAFIGSYSYSIYLWHAFILYLCYRWLGTHGNWPLYWVSCLIVPVVAGILIGRLVEYPMLRLRERFFPAPS